MSEMQSRFVQCPVLVLRVTEPQVMGDTIADGIRDELLARYEASGAVHVVLDMERVTYLASAGIRPLLSLNRKVREREGRLILCHLHKEVESVLLVTRLISSSRSTPASFESHPNVLAAVESLFPPSEGA